MSQQPKTTFRINRRACITVSAAFLVGMSAGITTLAAVAQPLTPPPVAPYSVPVSLTQPAAEVVTEYVEVPGPIQTVTNTVTEYVDVTDQAALDASYADGYATAEAQMDAFYASLEDDAYNRGLERGGAMEHEAFTTALTTPCVTEDSDNCYWDAAHMGNGIGQSFLMVGGVWYPFGTQILGGS